MTEVEQPVYYGASQWYPYELVQRNRLTAICREPLCIVCHPDQVDDVLAAFPHAKPLREMTQEEELRMMENWSVL